MTSLKIWFAGTPDFAATALKQLIAQDYNVTTVITQPSKPKGRGLVASATPVQQVAEQAGIHFLAPPTLRDEELRTAILSKECDLLIVAAYGKIIPEWMLNWPQYGCINIHASLLPHLRGASPIQQAILQGDNQTGITVMKMAKGLDEGDIITQKALTITSQETGQSLHDRLATLGGDMICDACAQLPHLLEQARPQDHIKATYAHKISKNDGLISWQDSADSIERRIRAFTPWPGSHSHLNGKRIKIISAKISNEIAASDVEPGTLLKIGATTLTIACGRQTCLELTSIQLPGKKIIALAELINGHHDLFTPGAKWR